MYIIRVFCFSLFLGFVLFYQQTTSASIPEKGVDREDVTIGRSKPICQSPEEFEEDVKSSAQSALHEKFDAFTFLLYNQSARWGFTFLFPWMPIYAVEGVSLLTAYVIPHDLFGAYSIIDGQVDHLFKMAPTKKGVNILKHTKDTIASITSRLWSFAFRGLQSINFSKSSWGFF